MKPGNVELYVEELVLDGYSPADRYRIGQAVEQELGRMFTEQGVPPSVARNGEIAGPDGGSFEVRPESGVEAIGIQIARAVYGGLGA